MAHDRNMLVLLYKSILQDAYPITDFEIFFEESIPEITNYEADLIIKKKDNSLVLWVEVGILDHEKACNIIEKIGAQKFQHIPYSHSVFQLDGVALVPSPFLSKSSSHLRHKKTGGLYDELKSQEIEKIITALENNGYHIKNTAKALNITYRQLRYKIEINQISNPKTRTR